MAGEETAGPAGGPTPDEPGDRPSRGVLGGIMALVIVMVAAVVVALALTDDGEDMATASAHGAHGPVGKAIGMPERHLGPQGDVGQFLAVCTFSHAAHDDPIVHYDLPGRSHLHDFYGSTITDYDTTALELLRSEETTCDKPADRAAYWQPALYDGDRRIVPIQIQAYYRAAPGVDPESVEPYPLGLEMLAGDAGATAPQESEAAGWVCGSSTDLSAKPPECPPSAPLHMLLTFPDCWDGRNESSADHNSHVAYSFGGECPDGYPVHIPQLTMSIKYPISGSGHDLSLASGNVYSAHGDFLNGWDPEVLESEIESCIHREAGCDLANNREEEGPFFHQ